MPTKCEVIIKDYYTYENRKYKFKITLYADHNGYPEGIGLFLLKWVLPKLQTSNDESCNSIANYLVKNHDFMVTAYHHLGIRFRYIIDIPKKQIYCYRGVYKSTYTKTNRPYVFKTLERINLKKFLPLTIENFYQ